MTSWTAEASSWLSSSASSRNGQLTVTAFVSAAFTSGAWIAYQTWSRTERTKSLKLGIPSLPTSPISNVQTTYGTSPLPYVPSSHPHSTSNSYSSKEDERSAILAKRARQGDYDDELIFEQLARNRVFLKDDGLAHVRSSFVIVVGCGGVGSHAAAALARSGVSRIRLIDFDQVTLSSLNRHSLATLADVGTPKVECIRKRLEQVTPWVHFDCRNELFSKRVAAIQLDAWDDQAPDFIVDAIDNIDSKVELLQYCYQNGLPIISSMGAGCKSDPTRIIVGDISASIEDPLSRSTRRRLKLLGITTGIPVVFSTEKSSPEKAQLLPLPEEEFVKGNVKDLSVMQDFRVRILPVLGTMPAMFGLCVANYILLELGKYPHEYVPGKFREKMYESILAHVQGSEERLVRWKGDDATRLRIPLTADDVGYLVEEVYRGRSAISGLPTRLALSRWRLNVENDSFIVNDTDSQKTTDLKLNNMVCMTKEEAAKHEKDVLKAGRDPIEVYSSEAVQHVEARMAEELQYAKFR